MEPPVVAVGPGKVEFHDCFVRGRGDLVSLRGCRLLNVEVKNSLIVLDNGSLLDIRANEKNLPMEQGVQWRMERSTVFATKSLFNLRCSSSGKGLTTTRANVEGCLLVAMGMDQNAPVVMPLDARPEDKYLEWEGKQNYYANFSDQLAQWKRQYPNDNFVEGKLTFPKMDDALKSLWNATPMCSSRWTPS